MSACRDREIHPLSSHIREHSRRGCSCAGSCWHPPCRPRRSTRGPETRARNECRATNGMCVRKRDRRVPCMGTHLVLDRAEETGLLLGCLTALVEDSDYLHTARRLLAERSGLDVAEAAGTCQPITVRSASFSQTYLAWTAPVRARANMVMMESVGILAREPVCMGCDRRADVALNGPPLAPYIRRTQLVYIACGFATPEVPHDMTRKF